MATVIAFDPRDKRKLCSDQIATMADVGLAIMRDIHGICPDAAREIQKATFHLSIAKELLEDT